MRIIYLDVCFHSSLCSILYKTGNFNNLVFRHSVVNFFVNLADMLRVLNELFRTTLRLYYDLSVRTFTFLSDFWDKLQWLFCIYRDCRSGGFYIRFLFQTLLLIIHRKVYWVSFIFSVLSGVLVHVVREKQPKYLSYLLTMYNM